MAVKQKTITKKAKKSSTINNDKADLIVFNDDYNTFDWVIQCFMEVCHLSHEEALSKTWYIHTHGLGIVRSGPYSEIKIMKDELVNRGLNAIVGRNLN